MYAFETDAMDDLFYDAVEGPARQSADEFDSFYAEDEFDGFDAAEDDDDAFIGGLIRGIGQVASGLMGGDEFDEMEDYGDYAYDYGDALDFLDDELADALEEEDTDEFFRRLRRIAQRVGRVAQRVGRGVGQAARVVGPIASMIPLPQAQLIGRAANIAGRLLADEADEFEALDEFFDFAEDEDAIDAAAPFVSAITVRSTVPGVSRMPRNTRRQLVRATTQATRTLARRQGPQAARAVPRIVRSVQRVAAQRRVPARAVPAAIRRAATRVAQNPRAVRRLARPIAPTAATHPAAMRRRRPIGAGGGSICPNCGRGQRLRLRGPITITIRGQR